MAFNIMVAAILAFCLYCMICIARTVRLKKLAALLHELLDSSAWADIMKLIKNEEYVNAVMDACREVLND